MARKAAKRGEAHTRAPWMFLILLGLFAGFLMYGWDVWYIPSLPQTETPPFLTSPAVSVSVQPVSGEHISTVPKTESPPSAKDANETEKEEISMPPTPANDIQQTTNDTAYRRRDGVYNILVAGKDDAALNTDVLILVSYDTAQQIANAVQIPRDTLCDGYKINALYGKYHASARRNGTEDAVSDGMRALCDTLEQVLAVRIDHWVLVDTAAFREIVDAVGGVTLNVPCNMDYDDPAQDLAIHLKAGVQKLDGAAAEQLVRFRKDYIRGDLGRVDMQKLFLSAFLTQCRDELSIFNLPAIVKSTIKHVSTDLSISDILFFAKNIRSLSSDKLTMMTLPGTDAREYGDSGAWYYVLSRPACIRLVDKYLNVYETSVAPHFDPNRRLIKENRPALTALYEQDVKLSAHTADDISENGISVATY